MAYKKARMFCIRSLLAGSALALVLTAQGALAQERPVSAVPAQPVSAVAAQPLMVLGNMPQTVNMPPAFAPSPAVNLPPALQGVPDMLPRAAADPGETQGSALLGFDAALVHAYATNPDLQAARAELRAVDETYAQAVSGYRPALSGSAEYESAYQDGDVTDSHSDAKTLALEVRQPLYRGGSTAANVRASASRINAQRALLHATEQRVLLDAVTTYLDVLRDEEIVRLNLNNERVLSSYLDASNQRFELGDITRTDVRQAESRLASAVASRVAAEGNYRASRGAFERVIGLRPSGLSKPTLSGLAVPATQESALAEAEQSNPDIVFARHAREAAHATIRAIKGELLPQVDLTGGLGRIYDPASRLDTEIDYTSIALRATVPLYTSGSVDARVREARQTESQRQMEIMRAERNARQAVVDAWAALTSAHAEITARETQIEAAKLALEGVNIETEYGSRTTLDLLDAEQEYLDAQVSYIIAERNRTVAAYRLMAATGGLTAEGLGLPVAVYDPDENFQNAKNKWIGTGIR